MHHNLLKLPTTRSSSRINFIGDCNIRSTIKHTQNRKSLFSNVMNGFRKSSVPRPSSFDSLYVNPLLNDNKENVDLNRAPKVDDANHENTGNLAKGKQFSDGKAPLRNRALRPSSLQLCIQMNEPDSNIGAKVWDPVESDNTRSGSIWDYSDSEAAPASSWSTLPNRSLLCRPLPSDIGRCTCVIVKEALPDELDGGTLYSLYTNEGEGRKDRKLALAHHKRRNGRSEFVIAQNAKGILCSSDETFIGIVTANLMGSKYHIWDQGSPLKFPTKQSKLLIAVITFIPTIATWTGNYRSMRAWIPKHQTMQLKNTKQIQHVSGLPQDWETKMDKVHKLSSRVPQYNKISKQYELDFRERGRAGLRIKSSVKNFQLTLEDNGRQTILQLGRVGKSKYVMDYRYPLTGYQAFCICLASIDSKLCCTV